ncbi:MAG: hypothetical protein PHR51_01915 [Patescibacteria group bacterium]|nr:hypothetical protein [Patescibacteria group bacterium]
MAKSQGCTLRRESYPAKEVTEGMPRRHLLIFFIPGQLSEALEVDLEHVDQMALIIGRKRIQELGSDGHEIFQLKRSETEADLVARIFKIPKHQVKEGNPGKILLRLKEARRPVR